MAVQQVLHESKEGGSTRRDVRHFNVAHLLHLVGKGLVDSEPRLEDSEAMLAQLVKLVLSLTRVEKAAFAPNLVEQLAR